MSTGRKGQIGVYAVAVSEIKLLVIHADGGGENFGLLVYRFSHDANRIGDRLAVLSRTDGDRRASLVHRTGIRANAMINYVDRDTGLHQSSRRVPAIYNQVMRTRREVHLEIRMSTLYAKDLVIVRIDNHGGGG